MCDVDKEKDPMLLLNAAHFMVIIPKVILKNSFVNTETGPLNTELGIFTAPFDNKMI